MTDTRTKWLRFRRRRDDTPRADPVRNRGGATAEVDAWNVSEFVLETLVPVVGVRPYPLHELMLMTAAVCITRPTLVFEWGTHVGKSARVFAEALTRYRIPGIVHSVDLPDDAVHVEHPHETRGMLVRGRSDVILHQGDGVDIALEVLAGTPEYSPPLFFVDGDHGYESVLRELTAIAHTVPAASIVVHDTFFQSEDSGYNIGPHLAIETLMSTMPNSYRRYDSGLGLPGMSFLRPIAAT